MGTWLNLALLAVLVATLYGPVMRELTVLGVFRPMGSAPGIAASAPVHHIEDTMHCEDLHYHARSKLIFTACEDSVSTRFKWFPPLGNLQGPTKAQGSIHVIDPKTMKSTRLTMENFRSPFITHGIEVIDDPDNTKAVYIFAVNHLSNAEFFESSSTDGQARPARSQVELFHHVLGSKTVRHVRSIAHELITTPNDLYAESPTSFYVTNDHYYREGVLRMVEDLVPAVWTWSSIVHVQLPVPGDDKGGEEPEVKVALTGLHNNNGMGHGQSDGEVLIASCISGVMYRARTTDNHTLVVQDEIRYDSALDNPSYFVDPWRDGEDDKSGYVQAGLRRAIDITKTHADPDGMDGVMVWYTSVGAGGKWETRLLLEDDGGVIRSASSAVMVAKEKKANGEKTAWLFVTGFVSQSVVAMEVTL